MTKSSLPVLKFLYQQNRKQISLNHHQKLQHLNLNNQVHHKLNQQKTENHGQKIEQAQERKANLQRKIKEIKSN